MKTGHSKRGFTIIELSIGIAIIGLMIAMIVGGASLLHSAQLRKVITEFVDYNTGINEFKESYEFLPGDLPNASSYWGEYIETPLAGANDGDGDSYMNDSEDIYAWRHLSLSEYISGSYTGAVASVSDRFEHNVNAPASRVFTQGLYRFYLVDVPIYNTRGHAIRLGTLDATGTPNNGIVPPKDAYSIDHKIDDGSASNGIFYGVDGAGVCVNESNEYSLDQAADGCGLVYWQQLM